MPKYLYYVLSMIFVFFSLSACQDTPKNITATVINLSSKNVIGTIHIKETKYGLIFQPSITDPHIQQGLHGFHVHMGSSCAQQGQAAGKHFNKNKTIHAANWYEESHAGDLPNLYFDKNGHANLPVLSNRLQLQDIQGKSLIIHDHTDSYTNHTHGSGGGKRIACAIIAQVTSI